MGGSSGRDWRPRPGCRHRRRSPAGAYSSALTRPVSAAPRTSMPSPQLGAARPIARRSGQRSWACRRPRSVNSMASSRRRRSMRARSMSAPPTASYTPSILRTARSVGRARRTARKSRHNNRTQPRSSHRPQSRMVSSTSRASTATCMPMPRPGAQRRVAPGSSPPAWTVDSATATCRIAGTRRRRRRWW